MKCTVKIILNEVTCPGILHLHDRNPVYITFHLFGQIQRSQPVYPSFPMVFNCKFKFRRIFTNAKTPEQVLEILEDECVLIELKQERKRAHGRVGIAQYEEVARQFLFPQETNFPKADQLKRDIFLVKTDYFNNGKGLNPQLSFRTKTIIEVAPENIERNASNTSISKQLPSVSFRDESYLPPTKASTVKRKKKKRPKTAPSVEYTTISEPEVPLQNLPSIFLTKDHQINSQERHCICECPELFNIDVDDWLESYTKKILDKKADKPFKVGKEPLNLISKRDFKSPKVKAVSRKSKGICQYCLVPSKQCVLCTAYKTLYGKDQFLMHCLKRKYENSPEKQKAKDVALFSGMNNFSVNKSGRKDMAHSAIGSPDSIFHNIPMSTPAHKGILSSFNKDSNKHSAPSYNYSKYERALLQSTIPRSKAQQRIMYNSDNSSDEDDIIEQHSQTTLYQQNAADAWKSMSKSYPTVVASPTESFHEESQRIHARIKELMKKNDSVLQHEISFDSSASQSSCESDNKDNDLEYRRHSLSRLSLEEPPLSTSSQRISIPARSVPVPLGAHQNWSSMDEDLGGRNRRDLFDRSLKHRYQELYEKTLNHR